MDLDNMSDLEVLQIRVASTEILLSLICEQLTDLQKSKIESRIVEQIDHWKSNEKLTEIFEGSKKMLNKKI